MKQEILKLFMPIVARSYYEEDEFGDYIDCEYPEEFDGKELLFMEDELNQKLDKYQEYKTERGIIEYLDDGDVLKDKVHSLHFKFESVENELFAVAVATLNESLNFEELEHLKDEVTGQASDGVGEGFEQQDIDFSYNRDIQVSMWHSGRSWFILTEEELELKMSDSQGLGMTME